MSQEGVIMTKTNTNTNATCGFEVYKESNSVKIGMLTFPTQDEAVKFCNDNGWELTDENQFVWGLNYRPAMTNNTNNEEEDVAMTNTTNQELINAVAEYIKTSGFNCLDHYKTVQKMLNCNGLVTSEINWALGDGKSVEEAIVIGLNKGEEFETMKISTIETMITNATTIKKVQDENYVKNDTMKDYIEDCKGVRPGKKVTRPYLIKMLKDIVDEYHESHQPVISEEDKKETFMINNSENDCCKYWGCQYWNGHCCRPNVRIYDGEGIPCANNSVGNARHTIPVGDLDITHDNIPTMEYSLTWEELRPDVHAYEPVGASYETETEMWTEYSELLKTPSEYRNVHAYHNNKEVFPMKKETNNKAMAQTDKLFELIRYGAANNKKNGYGYTVSAKMLCAYIIQSMTMFDEKPIDRLYTKDGKINPLVTDEHKAKTKDVRNWLIKKGFITTAVFKDEKGHGFFTPAYDGNNKNRLWDATKYQASGKTEATSYFVNLTDKAAR